MYYIRYMYIYNIMYTHFFSSVCFIIFISRCTHTHGLCTQHTQNGYDNTDNTDAHTGHEIKGKTTVYNIIQYGMVDFRDDNVGTYYMCKVTHRPTRVMLLNKSKNPAKLKL